MVDAIPATLIKTEQAAMTSLPNTKLIRLPQGKFCIVDTEDYEYLNQWKWDISPLGYVTRAWIRIHRVIMKAPDDMEVDHINGDLLDNRKCNLRICTHAQNSKNRKPNKNGKSKFKGVTWREEKKKSTSRRWRVRISIDGKRIHVGDYITEREAAIAYNNAALKYHGEYARLNIL